MANLSVVLSPALFQEYEATDAAIVVVDVLRATSTISAALEHGVEAVIPVSSMEEALDWQAQGFRVGGERNGQKIEAFDFGNSPYDYMRPDLQGETVVLTTTNGTRALHLAQAQSNTIITAALVNLSAVMDWLETRQQDVVIFCAGWKNKLSLEDTVCAGALVDGLLKRGFTAQDDAVLAARTLCHQAMTDPKKFLLAAAHRKRLMRLGLKRDIRYCLTPDQSSVIPILKGDRLIADGSQNR